MHWTNVPAGKFFLTQIANFLKSWIGPSSRFLEKISAYVILKMQKTSSITGVLDELKC